MSPYREPAEKIAEARRKRREQEGESAVPLLLFLWLSAAALLTLGQALGH